MISRQPSPASQGNGDAVYSSVLPSAAPVILSEALALEERERLPSRSASDEGTKERICFSIRRLRAPTMPNTNTIAPPVAEHVDATPHTERIDYRRIAPDALRAQRGLESYIQHSGLETSLVHLVKLRASYINGCAYCVDMHTKDARLAGETEQRLYAIPVWRETPFFTPSERAALAWTEAVTEISKAGVSDELYALARSHFTDKALVDLTMAVLTINGWNRLAITFHATVGSYVAGSGEKPMI